MVTPTIDALYRKIAGIENPLLCWSLASTRWNDNGICIPKELCSKIRSYLPPSTIEALPPNPGGGYMLDESTRFFTIGHRVGVEVCTDGVRQTFLFGKHDSISTLPLSVYAFNTGSSFNNVTLRNGIDQQHRFYHRSGNVEIHSREFSDSAEYRDVVVGALTCRIPISKINFDLPEIRECLQDLNAVAGNILRVEINQSRNGELEFKVIAHNVLTTTKFYPPLGDYSLTVYMGIDNQDVHEKAFRTLAASFI